MITLIKHFITAQRCDDWKGHIAAAQRMIPYFHASGHFHYAKCTHLYVQDILTLHQRYPGEHQIIQRVWISAIFKLIEVANDGQGCGLIWPWNNP